ncbi:hypothetical protein RhiirA4_508078 [Rhizophagus irregularis]|uniref:Uncharacterized protein n=1 Tax=Rhizophagus irregularis TaxID=588596 RepID=A0A2I1HD12_9GLOM|nr:hypothetical protein RhiirA4_508078 [Rhizophagus irregularis]
MERESSEVVRTVIDITNYQSNYDKIINDPIYEEIKLNKKLSEELKFSETLCNQLKDKYESLGKYCEDLQNNFININNILGEKQGLKKKIGDLNDHNSKLIKLLVETLEEKNNDNKIQELVNRIQEKNKIIKEKNNKIQKIVEEKDKKIQEKDKVIQELEEYQYALDAAINFDDRCKYNLDKLKEDIVSLQHSLEIYITKCKDNVEINIPEVQNLLYQYGSQTDITKDQKNPLIRVVIQRHVIEQILEYAREYFCDSTQPKFMGGMESFMYRRANELIDVAEAFAKKRDGIDDTTKVFPINVN